MSTIVVEVCANGTITRACARAINRAIASVPCAPTFSGSSQASAVVSGLEINGFAVRTVAAASLAGADKGRHTREVTRSRKAQEAREVRQAARAYHAADCVCGRTEATCLEGAA